MSVSRFWMSSTGLRGTQQNVLYAGTRHSLVRKGPSRYHRLAEGTTTVSITHAQTRLSHRPPDTSRRRLWRGLSSSSSSPTGRSNSLGACLARQTCRRADPWEHPSGNCPMLAPWAEGMLPLGIILVLVTGMGGLPSGVQHLFYGKPRAVGVDYWDRYLGKRDAELTASAAAQK